MLRGDHSLSRRLGVPTDGPRHARARSSDRCLPRRPRCDTDSLPCSASPASPSPSRVAEQTPHWRAAPCSWARACPSSCSTSCFASRPPETSSATPKRPPADISTNTVTGPTSHHRRRAEHRRTRSPMQHQPVGLDAPVPSPDTRASLLALAGEDSHHRREADAVARALARAPAAAFGSVSDCARDDQATSCRDRAAADGVSPCGETAPGVLGDGAAAALPSSSGSARRREPRSSSEGRSGAHQTGLQ
jgi:hypothetical protein